MSLDLDRALRWVERYAGPLTEVTELHGGWTSTMLAVVPASGDELVLRLMDVEPWRTHGAGLTAREHAVQRVLADTPVAAPGTRALDAEGDATGHPAHLMTRLPGRVDLDRADPASLEALARVLAQVHDVVPDVEVRTYQSWAGPEKHAVPAWSADPGLWEAAFEVCRSEPPAYEPTFLHRDFHLRNVLWDDAPDGGVSGGGGVSGVVDWVEASIGPAWLDVARCADNLALRHGPDVADAFAAAYVARTGRERQACFEVHDIVGFLPAPGRPSFFTDPAELANLELRLRAALQAAA